MIKEKTGTRIKHTEFNGHNKRGRNYLSIIVTSPFARAAIFDYIEVFYNRQRIHQTLNYQTPEQFEKLYDVA
jgi:putative transposase